MELIDNVNSLLGEGLRKELSSTSKLKIAASCFSMYAYETMKNELEQIEELEFIFTSPTFVLDEAKNKVKKQQSEFFIPKLQRERILYGNEFENNYREYNVEQIFKQLSPHTEVKVI